MVSRHLLARASMIQLASVGIASVAAAWLWPQGTSGVLLGGLVTSVNLLLMRLLTRRVLGGDGEFKAIYAVALGLKFTLLIGLITVIMTYFNPNIAAFALGMGTLFIGVGGSMLHDAYHSGRKISVSGEA